MICINCESTYQGTARVVIQAAETPDPMPTTGDDVTGLADGTVLAPGSILYVVGTGETYFLDEPDGDTPGEWIKWGGAADAEGGEG